MLVHYEKVDNHQKYQSCRIRPAMVLYGWIFSRPKKKKVYTQDSPSFQGINLHPEFCEAAPQCYLLLKILDK